jgi:uncharacterized coiled-coil DUF342 family protein
VLSQELNKGNERLEAIRDFIDERKNLSTTLQENYKYIQDAKMYIENTCHELNTFDHDNNYHQRIVEFCAKNMHSSATDEDIKNKIVELYNDFKYVCSENFVKIKKETEDYIRKFDACSKTFISKDLGGSFDENSYKNID